MDHANSSSKAVSEGSGSHGEGVRPTNFTFGNAMDHAVWIGIAARNQHQCWIRWPKLKLEGLTPKSFRSTLRVENRENSLAARWAGIGLVPLRVTYPHSERLSVF